MSGGDTGEPRLLPLRIRLPFASEQEFVERYGANVDRTTLFIATRSIKPEGTGISFELVLQDGARLMRGEGVVARIVQAEAPGQSGMQLRFTRLEARTKALVDQIVALREAAAAAPAPAPPPQVAAAPVEPKPEAPAPAPAPTAWATRSHTVLGIDLGTFVCRAALATLGRPQLLTLGDSGEATLPAVVALDASGALVAGAAAQAIAASHPERALFELKRLLGRPPRHPEVQRAAQARGQALSADDRGDAALLLGTRAVGAREAAAALLAEIKRCACALVGAEVRRAVVAVPAWFTHRQRQAMIAAASEAGLDVLQLVGEPSAVALGFGHGKGLARKRLLVFDFGDAAVHAAVVEMTGDELEVVSTAGDEASPAPAPPAPAPAAAPPSPAALRHDADQLLVDRSIDVTRSVLQSARLAPNGIDEVVVVRGEDRMPRVRELLEATLGRPLREDPGADGLVAQGAALFGEALSMTERGKSAASVAEVLGTAFGVAAQGGGFHKVLERNTRLPAVKTLPLKVTAGQAVQLPIFQGGERRALDNTFVGALTLVAEKSGELEVRFSVSKDGLLEVEAPRATFAAQDPGDEAVAALAAATPVPGEPPRESPSRGLLGGLRRLLGRP